MKNGKPKQEASRDCIVMYYFKVEILGVLHCQKHLSLLFEVYTKHCLLYGVLSH